jgi:hypothetical protein
MIYHESVSAEYVSDLCENYLEQSAWANAAKDEKERELRRIAGARPYSVAIERAHYVWTKPEVEGELSVRLTMGQMMKYSPDCVRYTEGY